jgi:hypothetical protein
VITGETSGPALPDPEPGPDEIREAVDEILGRDEFQPDEPSVFDEVLEWIGDQLDGLFQPGVPGGETSPLVGYAILGALLGGVGYLLWRWLRRVRPEPEASSDVPGEDERAAADWRWAAEQCEAEGRWKDALRCRYRVLVGELVERDAIPDVPGRTAGEYRVEVSSAFPEVSPPFGEATDLFERAWYADEPTGPAENERFRTLTDDVLERVR